MAHSNAPGPHAGGERHPSRTGRPRDRSAGVSADAAAASIREFFAEFARALTAGEVHSIAALWDLPALLVGDAAVQGLDSVAEVQSLFRGAREAYNARGISEARAEIVRATWPTDRIAVVEVRWPYSDRQGQEIGEETSTYTLRRNDKGDLRLRVVVMHGARNPH